jgi:hypothetical protein
MGLLPRREPRAEGMRAELVEAQLVPFDGLRAQARHQKVVRVSCYLLVQLWPMVQDKSTPGSPA